MRRALVVALGVTGLVLAACGGDDIVGSGSLATAELSYQLVESGQTEQDALQVRVPGQAVRVPGQNYWEQDAVRESAALVNFMIGLGKATDLYFADLIATCEQQAEQAEIECDPTQAASLGLTCEEWIEQQRGYQRLTCLGNQEVEPDIVAGLAMMEQVSAFLESEATVLGPDALAGEIALAEDIAANMAAGGAAPPYRDWGMGGNYGGMAECDAGGTPGSLGATPGGAQDIGYIRTVIEEGYVPLPFHLAVEGLFSEHDLPIGEETPCQQLLCVRTALGRAPVFGSGQMNYFLQLGFSSGLDPATFQRAPLNLVVVLDKSGSMSDGSGDELSKMGAVKSALTGVVDKLTPDDRLAIVVFESEYQVLLDSTPVDEPQAIKNLIATIEAGGGTNIEAGLRRGFEIAAANSRPDQRMDRVMLLTDALPNVGRTGEGEFLDLVRQYAEQDIGLSTFGVGFNFGQELILELSRIRGGNYFFLEDNARIEEVFGQDFDYLVTPLAYDLHLELVPGSGHTLSGVYGIQSWTPGDELVELDVATLFLSRNRGAIVIRLEGEPPRPR